MKEDKIFVYGTLMRRESNHHWLAESVFIGEDTLPGFELYDLGAYPTIVPGSGKIVGECYQVTPVVLRRLDYLEGHPSFYERQQHPLLSGCKAWVYVGKPEIVLGAPRISSGSWRCKDGFTR